jgi:hypothetical protein
MCGQFSFVDEVEFVISFYDFDYWLQQHNTGGIRVVEALYPTSK